MRAVRLPEPGGPERLVLERIDVPEPSSGEALVRVHAAAITAHELDWPEDRFPAIPSYELSGVVSAVGPGVNEMAAEGDPVFALTPFDRDGVAAEFAIVGADLLASRPAGLDDIGSAATPMAALTAWQGMFLHGGLAAGQRVLVLGGGGGVGHVAVQLARARGAQVSATASDASAQLARDAGADKLLDLEALDGAADPVDLVFDTVGAESLERAAPLLSPAGKIVTIVDEPPAGVEAVYFVVEPDGGQLDEIRSLVDRGELRPSIDSVYPLDDARAAFERSLSPGKRGKVVLRVP
jgi:NADPH:quinone reductase-like Zn-dependent oxidoreductase